VLAVQRSDAGAEPPAPLPGTRLPLGPLDLAGTAALASHLLGEPADGGLAGAIHEHSGGNPLFVEEIVRWLQRGGQPVLSGVEGAALGDLRQGLGASSTLQTLVLSRLDSLPLGQRDTARAASVVGAEFCRGEVYALRPPASGDARSDDLAGLESAGLVYLAENGKVGRYAFRQTVVREVGYYSLSAKRRRTLHARLAGYLEVQHASDLDPRAELLAHHHEAAEEFRPAAHYLLLAGHKARQRYAYPQAAACYDRALAALARLPVEERDAQATALQAQAHESRGDIALLTGDFAAATAAYEAALSNTQSFGFAQDRSPISSLHLKLALVLPTQGRAAEALALARQAWAERTADEELAVAATLAWLLWRSGDAEADAWIERAAALARREAGPWAAGIATLMADLAGDWTAAQRGYLARDQPAGATLAACREGDRHLAQGDVTGALALYEQAARLCQAEDDACGLALALYRRAEAHWQAADKAAARADLQEAQALLADAPCNEAADRQLVDLAGLALAAARTTPWPSWRWQRYDDALRISTLFRPQNDKEE
jgi:adenylate cyclase